MDTAKVAVRRARIEDLSQIISLVADIVVERESGALAKEVISDPPQEFYVHAFNEILKYPNEAFVAVFGDRVVGYLQISYIAGLMNRGRKRAIVEDVRISRHLRRSGLGKLLMEDAIRRAKENDCWVIQLTTNKWREDAIGFYEKLGFRRTHEGLRIQL